VNGRFNLPALLLLTLVACVAASAQASAQRQWNTWYFGFGAGLEFVDGVPRAITGGRTATLEGTAAISDRATGALLFYTDGVSVWNREHAVMPNGVDLHGNLSSAQSALIVPDPGDVGRYYIFTTDAYEDFFDNGAIRYDGLNYSIVDMALDSGRGDVVEKNIRLAPRLVAEKLTAVRRCDDGTYWVIAHEANTRMFVAYHLDATGIDDSVASFAGSAHSIYSPLPPRRSDLPGYLKSSPDGRRLVTVHGSSNPEIFDFDVRTGAITVAMVIPDSLRNLYGVSFSPDGTKLYTLQNVTGPRLVQYDLTAGSPAAVRDSRVELARYYFPGGALQLGPDGRLYVAIERRTALDVVTTPNEYGAAAGLVSMAVPLGAGTVGWGLPNIIDDDLGIEPRGRASRDTVVCPGASVTIRATGGVRYRWRDDPTISCSECDSTVATPRATTSYIVEIEGANGCFTRDTVVVTVHQQGSVDAGAPQVICRGDTATLSANGGVRWQWAPADGLTCVDCRTPRAAPDATTTYTVTAWSDGGCLASDTVTVRVNAIPRIDATGDTTVCAATPVQLHASGGAVYRWSPADGLSCIDCADPIATIERSGGYRVVGISADGCVASDSVRIAISTPVSLVAFAAKDRRVAVGGGVIVPVRVSDAAAIAGERAVELEVRYDPSTLMLIGIESDGTLLDGGRITETSSSDGVWRGRLEPGAIRTNDTLVDLAFRAFLGSDLVTPVDITVTPTSRCVEIASVAGSVRLDSLCGLNQRLIEFLEPFALDRPRPNPFTSLTTIAYRTGAAAHVRARLFDAAGREVLRPLDRWVEAGEHTLELDAGSLPSGVLVLRLECGGSVRTASIVRR
jgi:hypothetical protein